MVNRPTPQYNVQVTWLGHSTFRLVSPEGKVIIIDPYLTGNPKCPPEFKNLEQVKVDLILITHDHADHAGDALALAQRSGARVAALGDVVRDLAAQGLDASKTTGFNVGGTVKVDGIGVSMVKAVHTTVHGIPAGLVITFENGFRVYHAGDTALFGDMSFIGRIFQPHLALVPIGGHFTMDAHSASIACRELLKPQYVIPMHYGTMPVLAANPDQFVELMRGSGIEVFTPQPGETLTF